MKKLTTLFGGLFVVLIIVVIFINVNLSFDIPEYYNIGLSNIEALSQNEGGFGECYEDGDIDCRDKKTWGGWAR